MKKFTLFLFVAAMILPLTMNAQTKNDVPDGYASVTLTVGDVWGDGSGYQMLLDENATAYGSIIPETGALITNCSGNETVYAAFEYKIPGNADSDCSTENIIINNSITILIPAGVYDWCITNPTPGDRIWIASENGNVGGRADDYEFLSGVGYEFTVTFGGSNDQVDVTIDDPTAPVIPTDVQVTPTSTTGEVVWVAGENNASWTLRWRPWVDPASLPVLWDLPVDSYLEQIEGWSTNDADGDEYNWGLAYSSDAQDDVCFVSASYSSGIGVLSPDNWLITPEVNLGGTLKFKTWNKSSNYPDKIMVYVCENLDYASLDEFVQISDFIMPLVTSYDEAEEIELDLSAYEGMGHIAFRHYDCYDKWEIYIDDIEVIPANPATLQEWTVVEDLMIPSYTIENLTPGTKYEVQVMASNESGVNTQWTEIVLFETLAISLSKHIEAYTETTGYYLIASPVGTIADASTVTGLLNGDFDLYKFDQQGDAEGKEWLNYEAGAFTTLEAGNGYLYANATDVDLVFPTGTYEGTGTFTLDYTAEKPFAGYNLMGNPYDVAANVDRPFYTLNPTTNKYVSHAANTSVEAMEGIIVIAEGTDEEVTFTVGTGVKSANAALNITQNGQLIDRAIMTFEGRNLPKAQFNPNNTKVYMPVNGKDYAVAAIESAGEMPVNFKAENNGTYTLNFSAENVEFGYLHLIDNMTGADIDLLANPNYSFEAKTTDLESRFKLVFAQGDNSNSDNFAFVSNDAIIVNGEGMLQMFDVTGRMVYTAEVNSAFRIPNSAFTSGVYVLQLNEKTQKIVIK